MLKFRLKSAPKEYSPDETIYSYKTNSDTFVALLDLLKIPSAIVLCHDWGSMIAWRLYAYHPTRVSHIISICIPYDPPRPGAPFMSTEELAKKLPNFKYQIGLADPQTLADLQSKESIRKLLKAMYRGIGDGKRSRSDGSRKTSGTEGINVDKDVMKSVGDMPRGWVISEEDLEWYVDKFYENGMHGPLGYYKNRLKNYNDELVIRDPTIKVPVLFVGATRDAAVPPFMAAGQGKYIPNLTSTQVEASHWMVWEKTDEVNGIITNWVENVVFSPKSKL
ncbi:hypothetical protein ABW20_dc0103197 [Dactylellina cionopaga]|nr:hypothetical protein ABW20_dc0103197 [Dactylellina cionopaga]